MMKQRTIDETYRRLGYLIGYERRKRLSAGTQARYTQAKFVLTTPQHRFFATPLHQPVCSRITLSRLENGAGIRETELYGFFLAKLGYSAGISERAWRDGLALARDFREALRSPGFDGEALRLSYEHHVTRHPGDLLVWVQWPWIQRYLAWIEEPRLMDMPQIEDLIQFLPVFDSALQPVIADWIALLLYFQPLAWTSAYPKLSELHQRVPDAEFTKIILDLFKRDDKTAYRELGTFILAFAEGSFWRAWIAAFTDLIATPEVPWNQPEIAHPHLAKLTGLTFQHIQNLSLVKKTNLVEILRYEPYPTLCRHAWLIEMSHKLNRQRAYRKFTDLFIQVFALNKSIK